MLNQLPPIKWLGVGLGAAVLLLVLTVELAIRMPWLGLALETDGAKIVVTSVHAGGPAVGRIAPETALVAVRDSRGKLFTFESSDFREAPEEVATFALYNRFFERQAQLYESLTSGPVELVDADGLHYALEAKPRRPLSALPGLFWYQVFCGLSVALIGLSAFAFCPKEVATRYFCLASWAMGITICAAAVYAHRQFVMPAESMRFLSYLTLAGSELFAAAGAVFLWHYPSRLARFPVGSVAFPAAALVFLLGLLQWVESVELLARGALITWFFVQVSFTVLQWRNTRQNPLARARLKWLVFSWFTGIVLFLVLVTLPQLLGEAPLLNQKHAWGLLVLSYLGICLGIVKFRLFELDRWMVNAWIWLFFGLSIVFIDTLIIHWLKSDPETVILLSLAILGWIYFPVRQWLIGKALESRLQTQNASYLPGIIKRIFAEARLSPARWRELLGEVFMPLSVESRPLSSHDCLLEDNGLRLHIPCITDDTTLVLSHAAQGRRLFNQEDIALAQQMREIFKHAQAHHQRYADGEQAERLRIARDLHDDIGARLLSIIYKAQDDAVAELARTTMQELRELIFGLQHGRLTAADALALLRAEVQSRCLAASLDLHFSCVDLEEATMIDASTFSHMLRILREALSNTLKHAVASEVQIDIDHTEGGLNISYADNGRGFDPASPSSTSGLHNMRARAIELGRELCWWCALDRRIFVGFFVPLSVEEKQC